MWIDTHTHFDAKIFDDTRIGDWEKAQSLGVSAQFVMGGCSAKLYQNQAVGEYF